MRWLVPAIAVLAAITVLAAVRADAQAPARPPPSLDPRAIVGHDVAEVSAGRRVVRTEGDEIRFADGLVIHVFHGARVAERSVAIPAGMTCDEIPAWLGLPPIPGAFPLRRADGCEWPGRSPRHVLAPGLAARVRGGVLTVWRAP